MNWFEKKKSSRRKSSSTKRKSSSTKRRPSRPSSGSNKRSNKFCFVKGKPRIVHPKVGASGYFYTRRTSDGKTQKISVSGKTYTKTEALSKVKKIRAGK